MSVILGKYPLGLFNSQHLEHQTSPQVNSQLQYYLLACYAHIWAS